MGPVDRQPDILCGGGVQHEMRLFLGREDRALLAVAPLPPLTTDVWTSIRELDRAQVIPENEMFDPSSGIWFGGMRSQGWYGGCAQVKV